MQDIVALVDLDEKDSWRASLPIAIDYARHTGARLHVLTIVPDGMFKLIIVAQLIPADYERRLKDDARQRLGGILKQTAIEPIPNRQQA